MSATLTFHTPVTLSIDGVIVEPHIGIVGIVATLRHGRPPSAATPTAPHAAASPTPARSGWSGTQVQEVVEVMLGHIVAVLRVIQERLKATTEQERVGEDRSR